MDRLPRAWHLGWDDYKLHPGHLASKNPGHRAYPHYREIELIERPPTLSELANAAPCWPRRAPRGPGRVGARARLEPSRRGRRRLGRRRSRGARARRPRARTGAAGAVALIDPPADRRTNCCRGFRTAADTVVALAPLSAFGGRWLPTSRRPDGRGRELPGPAEVPLALAAAADADPALADRLGFRTLDEREHWLALFAAGAFGTGPRRLWIGGVIEPLTVPAEVARPSTAAALARRLARGGEPAEHTLGDARARTARARQPPPPGPRGARLLTAARPRIDPRLRRRP